MSKPDEFDAMAEWLLPCAYDYVPVPEGLEHWGNCPAYYRPAVAAKLRERELQWRELLSNLHDEIAGLRAQLAAAEAAHGSAIADLMACRDGALVRDLRAQVERLKAPWLCDCHTWPSPIEAHGYIVALEAKLVQIYEALDGLPISGEQTGPKSRKYLDAVEQIKALRAHRGEKIVQLEAALKEARAILHSVVDGEGEPIDGDVVCIERKAYENCKQWLAREVGK